MPLAWLLGVNWCECSLVGELIGIKTIVNEFVAYSKLSEMLEQGKLSVGSLKVLNVVLGAGRGGKGEWGKTLGIKGHIPILSVLVGYLINLSAT